MQLEFFRPFLFCDGFRNINSIGQRVQLKEYYKDLEYRFHLIVCQNLIDLYIGIPNFKANFFSFFGRLYGLVLYVETWSSLDHDMMARI